MNIDVRGIDLDKITAMAQSVSSYKRDCNTTLANITNIPNSMLSLAIKGQAQQYYNSSVTRLRNRMTSIVNQLSQFESALNNEIRRRYQTGEQNIASGTFGNVR